MRAAVMPEDVENPILTTCLAANVMFEGETGDKTTIDASPTNGNEKDADPLEERVVKNDGEFEPYEFELTGVAEVDVEGETAD